MKDDLLEGLGRQQGPQIDPLKYPALKCDKCGCMVFEQSVIYRVIPGILVGTAGDDVNYPIPVYTCKQCGAITKDVREELEKADKEIEENKSSSLIL